MFTDMFIRPRRRVDTALRNHAFVGRRFCKVQMNGCMAHVRGKERWGTVRQVEDAVSDRHDRLYICLSDGTRIYDGGQSEISRDYFRKRGELRYALVEYDNGKKEWEPAWALHDAGPYLEYQI